MSLGLDGKQRGNCQWQEKKWLHDPKGKATVIYQVGTSFLLRCLFFWAFFLPAVSLLAHELHTDLNTWIWGRGELRLMICVAVIPSWGDYFLRYLKW